MFSKLRKVYAEYSNENNILIYQLGKVGSTALEGALPGSIHTHTLYGRSPCHVHLSQRRKGLGYFYGLLGDLIKRVALRRRRELKVISIVREPISRNYSMFFQDLSHWIYKYVGDGNHDTRTAGMEYLFDVYRESFDHDYVLNWYDFEFRRLTGIDVMSEDFNQALGYTVIEKGKVTAFVCRYEDLGGLLDELSDFCGSEVVLSSSNVGDDKWYGKVYKEFKSNFIPENKYLDYCYKSKYAKKFYGQQELDAFRSYFVRR